MQYHTRDMLGARLPSKLWRWPFLSRMPRAGLIHARFLAREKEKMGVVAGFLFAMGKVQRPVYIVLSITADRDA